MANTGYLIARAISRSRPGRRGHPPAHPLVDFVLASHGPDHDVLLPRTARADRFLDTEFGHDVDGELWCDGGLRVHRSLVRETLELIRVCGLIVE